MDSILFDLDGTLWDPVDTVLAAWNGVLAEELQRELTRTELEETMGLQMDEISRKLFPDLDKNQRQRIVELCSEAERVALEKHGGNLYDNVERVIEELSQSYKLFIVSNCQEGYIEAFYKYHQLEQFFLDFENPGRTGLSKGENIKLVMERNNLSQSVYVGDTEGDLEAARQAGIPFIYAAYGFGQASAYKTAIGSFEELLNIFKEK